MQLVDSSNVKNGGGLPSPWCHDGKEWWCSLRATVATLPRSKQSLHRPRLNGCRMEAWLRLDGGGTRRRLNDEAKAWAIDLKGAQVWSHDGKEARWCVTCQKKEGGGESLVEPPLATWWSLSGGEELAWVQTGPLYSMETCSIGWGRGPIALIMTVDEEMIGRQRILCWQTSQRDSLTANPSAASKLLSQTMHWYAMECGSDNSPPTSHVVSHRPPEKKYPSCLLRCDGIWVVDLSQS